MLLDKVRPLIFFKIVNMLDFHFEDEILEEYIEKLTRDYLADGIDIYLFMYFFTASMTSSQ